MNTIIQINGVSAGYEGKNVLSKVDLKVYERDFLGIIGPNGGGKTTLIKCILGLHRPNEGNIRFYKAGKEVSEINMGYLPQYNTIDRKFPISVYEVVLSGLSKQKALLSRYNAKHHEQTRRIIAQTIIQGEVFSLDIIGHIAGIDSLDLIKGLKEKSRRQVTEHQRTARLDYPVQTTNLDRMLHRGIYSTEEKVSAEKINFKWMYTLIKCLWRKFCSFDM